MRHADATFATVDLAIRAITPTTTCGARVLVVDPDRAMRDLLGTLFDIEGYDVTCAPSLATAHAHLRENEVDLVVTDLDLGDGNAFDVLACVAGLPVVVLAGTDSSELRVRAMRMGADDVVTKPFVADEIAARVAAILRRMAIAPAVELITFEGLEIDLRGRTVTFEGAVIVSTAKEFDLLAFLAGNAGRIYTRHELLISVWQSSSEWQQEATVTEHIRRLRHKLIDAGCGELIQTMRGVGYGFGCRQGTASRPRP